MFDLRDMQLVDALVRHGHFARAAESCGISQPAFSARIRKLEADLDTPIVNRGNRFLGLTPEGEIVLSWARRLLADADAMRQEIEAARGALSGRLTLGVVPSALAYAARLPERVRAEHPGLKLAVHSASSSAILRGLDDFTFDAGISYLGEEIPADVFTVKLYDERYELLVPEELLGDVPNKTGKMSWADAARLPLSMLTPDMRNRRILNEVFAGLGVTPNVAFETNAITAMLAHASEGAAATIAPEILVDTLRLSGNLRRLELVEPFVTKPIGLISLKRDVVPPALAALRALVGNR